MDTSLASTSPLGLLRPQLRSVGVTGTNGKTTTTSMVAAIVAAADETSARATTLGTWVGEQQLSADVSMVAFRELLLSAIGRGVRTLAVETTSKALAAGFSDEGASSSSSSLSSSLHHNNHLNHYQMNRNKQQLRD